MKIDDVIEGKNIDIRSVLISDAEFIVSIRNDETKNKYVHAVDNDVEKQKDWIKKQMSREGDYYFIIEDKSGIPVGLASIYNVGIHDKGAEFGRWISWGTTIQNVESVLLTYDFAFENLEVDYIYTRTMKENIKVKRFWKSFGAESIGDVFEDNLWLSKHIITKEMYYRDLRDRTKNLLRY